MKGHFTRTILALLILFTGTTCTRGQQPEIQTWSTLESEVEGRPLLWRKPNYENILIFKDKYPRMLRVTHILDKVADNGLPETNYNLSLNDFDESMTKLFDIKTEGIIFLVETFGGNRNYFYYISNSADYNKKIEGIKKKYKNINLDISSELDTNWKFIDSFATKLY